MIADQKQAHQGDERLSGRRYHLRQYEPADIDDICALYGTVTGRPRSADWIDWKFTRSPYADDVSMFVAEKDGRIVGVRPYHVVPLRAGTSTLVAGYLQNGMVHPDHRGEGVFSRLSQHAVDHLDERVSLLFCLANEDSRAIYTHWGWDVVTTARTYYRPQNIATLLAFYRDDRFTRRGGRIGTAVAQGVLSVCDWLSAPRTELRIEHETGVPARQLAALYRQRTPETLHVRQDEAFYRWRFESPEWHAETYTAMRGGEPVAAAVTRTRTAFDDVTTTHVADVVPVLKDSRVLSTLLQRAVTDHRHSDILAATETTIPPGVLVKSGFVPDDRPPFSLLHTGYTLLVRALDEVAIDLEDESNWSLPLAVRDTN